MLDFYFIDDEQPSTTPYRQLKHVCAVEEEEFEMAQKAGLIEARADYYSDFRWSSEQVKNKLFLLANCPFRLDTSLNRILSQAKTAGVGLKAFGE